MPSCGVRWIPQEERLTLEETVQLAGWLVEAGIRRLRLTGGEPLLVPELESLVRRLAALPGVEDLSLTTNGFNLARRAEALAAAGLRRVTVSLDSLDPAVFRSITRTGDLGMVWEGLWAADRAGLTPLKVNCVVMRENLPGTPDLAALTLERPWEVRFIEYMPVTSGLKGREACIPNAEVRRLLEERFGPLRPAPSDPHAPARTWRLAGGRGRVGFISSVTESFCGACDRLRLLSNGFLKLCMAHPDGLDLRTPLRAGAGRETVLAAVREAVWRKPAGHAFQERRSFEESLMSRIGG